MRNRIAVIISVALLLAIVPGSAKELSFEYDYPVVSHRWGISVGGFLVHLDTTVSYGFGSALGSVINLEEVLHLEEHQENIRIEGFVRLAPRHALEFGLLEINRTATAFISDPINFGEFQFTGSAKSKLDILQFKTIYMYSFINNGQVNAGLSTGLSWFSLDASIRGDAALLDGMGNPITAAMLEETVVTYLAPVPSLGMFVEYAPARWVILRLQGQFFDLDIGDVEFRFSDTRIVTDFYFTKHVGIGIGLNTTRLEYVDTGEDPLRVDFRFGGVLFHVNVTF